MRWLAYGGTRYAERVRVGRWPESLGGATSDFEDTFDIPTGEGLLSYGVGILDNAAVLILRERQNEEDRGGYPYTLLLDPGVDVWRRHDWNPPLLAASLRRNAELWHRLMVEPQRLSSADMLEGPLASLQPADVACDSALEAGAALAATLEGDGLHFPISVMGVASRPSLETMAATLAALPEPVRIGGGWMVGGGRNGRWTFGCRAVFDDVSPTAEPDAHACGALDAGARLLQLIADVSARLSPDVSGVFAAPPLAWSTPPGALSTALRMASAAVRDGVSRTTADDIAAFLAETTPYGAAVLDVWKRALRSQQHFSPSASRVFLKHDWDRIDASLASRLSADAIGEEFHARRVTPAASEAKRFGLTPEQQAAVWASLVSRAPEAGQAVALTGDAVVQMHGHSPELVAPIITNALKRTAELQGDLSSWTAFRGRGDVWPAVRRAVTAAARARAGSDARWQLDYVRLAEDPGGAWLAAQMPDAVPVVISALLDETAGGRHAEEAMAWLAALASTPARAHAGLAQKRQIAQGAGGRWTRLRALDQLCAGMPHAAIAAPPLTAVELKALAEELRGLLSSRGRSTSRAPLDLEALDRIFEGKLTTADLPQSAGILGPVTHGSFGWLAERGGSAIARDLAVRTWLDRDAPVPLDEIDDEGLRALVSAVFDNARAPGESDRELASDLLVAAGTSQPLMALIAASLTAASRDGQKSARLTRLMARDPALAANMLGAVDPHDGGTLLQSAAETDTTAVARLVEIFVSHVSEYHRRTSAGAVHALQDFLGRSSPAVRAVRDRAGRALFGPDAIYLSAYMDELCWLLEADEPLEQDLAGARLMRRVRNWLDARRQ